MLRRLTNWRVTIIIIIIIIIIKVLIFVPELFSKFYYSFETCKL